MNTSAFSAFLESCPEIRSYKAILTRISKGRAVEKQYGVSLDSIVASDNLMKEYLERINIDLNNKNGGYSNALRKYYIFCNGTIFPQLKRL